MTADRLAVLVVDDEEADLVGLTAILEGAGFRVRQAGSLRDAAVSYVTEPVDVVVTDVVMPGGDGVDLIRGLRQLKPDLPVVAVSGKGPAGLAAAKAMGAAYVLTKPVDSGELVQAVRAAAAARRTT